MPEVLMGIASGKTLAQACKPHGFDPNYMCFLRKRWPELDEAYYTAVEIRGERMVDDILTLVDSPIPDAPENVTDPIERTGYKKLELERRRQIVDTKKWAASKMYARIYGDKTGANVAVQVNNSLDIGSLIREATARRESAPRVVEAVVDSCDQKPKRATRKQPKREA